MAATEAPTQSQPEASAQTDTKPERGLLVGDVLIQHPDLDGLDQPAELFAVEVPETDVVAPIWGAYWQEALASAPPLPATTRLWLPDEGGFVLRPLHFESLPSRTQHFEPDSSRRVLMPPRTVHAALNFPTPKLVSNELFIELRYAMSPSLVRWLDFEDIRSGALRIFALPGFEGDVRLVTVVDEDAASTVVANQNSEGMQRKRLLQFLHAAAASPPAAQWPHSTALAANVAFTDAEATEGLRSEVAGSLFPHQKTTLGWMRGVESQGTTALQVDCLEFAGERLGSSYDVSLPKGGVIGHPPGSGKTRILACLVAADGSKARANETSSLARTVVICPAHLCRQWAEELALVGHADGAIIKSFEEAASQGVPPRSDGQGWLRLILDEPQDCPPGDIWKAVQQFAEEFRGCGAAVWLLCGTAKSHLESIGRLLLGQVGWHVASRQSEWRACPQLAHLIRNRFVADPPYLCLPMPELMVERLPVILRPRESADAAVASLAGFALDGVMLLSFGPEAAFAAARERDELLVQMGWLRSVGNSLMPVTEHNLADWESTVVQRSESKLADLSLEIARLEADEGRHAARYLFAGGDAALAPELGFLAGAAVRVELQCPADEIIVQDACAAEWNDLLEQREFGGLLRIVPDVNAGGYEGTVLLCQAPDDGDFASVAQAAAAHGARAILFEADREGEARPFSYRHDQEPPPLPSAMLDAPFYRQLEAATRSGVGAAVRLLLAEKEAEAEADLGQGLLSAFINNDAVDDDLHRRVDALRAERHRCERSLRFARQMRGLLEQNEAHCPVCFRAGDEAEAFAVLPDCFHVLCRGCLDSQVTYDSSVACPLCRTNVARLDIVVFRVPSQEATSPKKQLQDTVADDPPDRPGDEAAESEHVSTTTATDNPVGHSRTAWESLPSKLQRLVDLLTEILASSLEERILVYTQWAVHVAHLQEVLVANDIANLALLGDLAETMDALSRFGKEGEPRVLLLSSQRHSSGINLQAARHVVIVHPYCTPTSDSRESISRAQMLSFEAQAVGRVRRYPQQQPVHVYRMFASGTIEEELYVGR